MSTAFLQNLRIRINGQQILMLSTAIYSLFFGIHLLQDPPTMTKFALLPGLLITGAIIWAIAAVLSRNEVAYNILAVAAFLNVPVFYTFAAYRLLPAGASAIAVLALAYLCLSKRLQGRGVQFLAVICMILGVVGSMILW